MYITVRIEGLNLEKLLRAAPQEGIRLRHVGRAQGLAITVSVHAGEYKALCALCARYGWEVYVQRFGPILRAGLFFVRRCMFLPACALCFLMVYLSSMLVLSVQIDGAGAHEPAVRAQLKAEGAHVGALLGKLSTDALREGLEYALPGLSFAGVRIAGSTIVVTCYPAAEGEMVRFEGSGMDIVASQSGIVSSIWALSGTPQVEPGQAVAEGQVLILGQERSAQGETIPVQAQGEVIARVFSKGEARVRLKETTLVETGQTRRRVLLCTPWFTRVVAEAKPYENQVVSSYVEPLAGLYLPVWRRIEIYEQAVPVESVRSRTDAMSMAQGAAQEIAKNNCPSGVQILDKWVDYSMIDNEFVYASVVLEYEHDIAVRADAQ